MPHPSRPPHRRRAGGRKATDPRTLEAPLAALTPRLILVTSTIPNVSHLAHYHSPEDRGTVLSVVHSLNKLSSGWSLLDRSEDERRPVVLEAGVLMSDEAADWVEHADFVRWRRRAAALLLEHAQTGR